MSGRTLLTAVLLTALAAPAALAQNRNESVVSGSAAGAEYESIASAVRVIVDILQNVTREHAAAPVSDQLQGLTVRLTDASTASYGGFRGPERDPDDLVKLLRDIERELRSVARSLEYRDEDDLAHRLENLVDRISETLDDLDNPERREYTIARADDDDWWRSDDDSRWDDEERWSDGDRWEGDDWDAGWGRGWDRRWKDDEDGDYDWRNGNWDWEPDLNWDWGLHPHSKTFVGDYSLSWPYQEEAGYRPVPSFRYNRVEGLVLGFGRAPLSWRGSDTGRIYGQAGYALGLEDWRYEVGAETRFGRGYNRDFDVKIGGGYHMNTGTDDAWKSNWIENSLAALLFRHDFFDYYETEGWTAYLVGRITPYVQFSAGFREDDYRSMANEVDWSVFRGNDFRINPAIDEGTMRSAVFTLEGGSVRALSTRPSGAAFRLEAEVGQGLGGDFDFSRYQGDVRTYTRFNRDTGFSLRFRGGFTEGEVPVQKAFTLGGAGSVRAYSQNSFLGTRMMLANAELGLYDADLIDWLLDDVSVFGIFDAGWTNAGGVNEFNMEDVIPAAGFGISLDERNLRFEIAWPLKDLGAGSEPSIWFRLNPTF